MLPEDPILLPEIIDHVFLVAVHPASGRKYEEAQSVGHSPRLLREQPLALTLFRRFANLGRFVAPYAVEKFDIVSLNTTHRVLRTTILSSAILDASLVHPAIVFRTPAAHHATAIVLFHDHPSGDPTPSGDDVALTARLCEAGTIMGIDVLDHMILAESRQCSFKEMGRL